MKRPASFYVCLNKDKGVVLAFGTLGTVEKEVTANFGSCVAALQVSEETAQGLVVAGFTWYQCGKETPSDAWFASLEAPEE